jgi:Zn-dependent protease with chaperone function
MRIRIDMYTIVYYNSGNRLQVNVYKRETTLLKVIDNTAYDRIGTDEIVSPGSSLLFLLKKWQLGSIRAKYVRTQVVRLPGGAKQEVTVFSGNNCILVAQYTPLGTIAIHESAFNDEKLLNYVLMHEKAHQKQWWSLLRIPLTVFIVGLWFLSRFMASGQTATTVDLNELVNFVFGLITMLLLFASFSWLMEFDADFQAIKAIGIQSFVDLSTVSGNLFRFNLRAVFSLLTHPPRSLTARLWRCLHQGSAE